VLGTSLSGTTGKTTLAAFSASGQLIEDFATGGKLDLDMGPVSAARELHVGDLVLRAFGTRQSDGRLVVGTTNGSTQQQSQSALRRLNVPGSKSVSAGTPIATFGVVNGKNQKYTYTDDATHTKITFSIKGGTGTLFKAADGTFNLVLTDGGAGGMTVSVKGKDGNGRIAFGDITANGTVKSMSVKNGDLSGTFSVAGSIGKLTLGNIADGAAIAAAGNITSVSAASMTNAKLLAGANLGGDAAFGGTGASADSYGQGSIGTLKIAGQIVGSTIGAGLNPVDATFGDDDDQVVGGTASLIKSITAKGADDATRFVAGAFGKVKIGTKVNPTTDPRFRVLA
jgi:hypothetical protein